MTKKKDKMITVRLDPEQREETLKNVEEWIGYDEICFYLNCISCLDVNEVEQKVQSIDNLSICYMFEGNSDRIELSMFFQDDENIDISVIKNKGNAFTLCNNNKPLILLLNDKSDLTEQSTDHKYIYLIKRYSDLSGMEKFTELTKLVIRGEIGIEIIRHSEIKNVDVLKNLTKITNLDFIRCGDLQNVDGLKNFVKLEILNLIDCDSLQNVDGLKNLTNLTNLYLSDCKSLQNVDGLKNLTNLTNLHLYDCKSLQNVEELTNLKNLTTLDLVFCKNLQNVDGLKDLIKINKLDLSGCKNIVNVDGLKNLNNLTILKLEDCKSLKDVDELKNLSNIDIFLPLHIKSGGSITYLNTQILEGLIYKKNEKIPYTGKAILFNSNMQKVEEMNIKNGKANGMLTLWNDNGLKIQEETFKNGKKNGMLTVWNDNGQKCFEKNMKNGNKHGKCIYYKKGEIGCEVNYINDIIQDDKLICWHENGEIFVERNFKDGKEHGKHTLWFENGHKEKEENYKNGVKHGKFVEWDSCGKITSEKNYKDGVQEVPSFLEGVNDKAKKLYKNEKGFWEAEFNNEIVMIHVPEGDFTMGDSELDGPEHKVYLDGYWIGKHPVTFEQYDAYCEDTGKELLEDKKWGRGKRPVINIDWQRSVDYCNWLSDNLGLRFRLPTEAEWEKAAKGTGNNKYPWGDEEPDEDLANFDDYYQDWKEENKKKRDDKIIYNKTTPVGQYSKGASTYGCLDMAGNVWEWCYDWFHGHYYENSPSKNPKGPESGLLRVFRGGSCYRGANNLRCAFRDLYDPSISYHPSYGNHDLGFRLMFK